MLWGGGGDDVRRGERGMIGIGGGAAGDVEGGEGTKDRELCRQGGMLMILRG